MDRPKVEPQTREDAGVGRMHGLVGTVQAVFVEVEGISVLHEEFARAHDAEAGADLVPKLGLDLVEIHRQLAMAADFAPEQVGDDLLMGRPQAKRAFVAIGEAQQLGPVLFPAAGFLPQFGGLHHGHQQFQGAAAIHFLPHDLLHPPQHT